MLQTYNQTTIHITTKKDVRLTYYHSGLSSGLPININKTKVDE